MEFNKAMKPFHDLTEVTMRIVFNLMVAASLVLTSCSPVPKTTESMKVLEAEVQETIVLFEKEDPGIRRFFEQSAGYAVLPKVFKGALWIGGAYGKGLVYQNEKLIGYCNMSQATLGFSFGGEFFREIIFFRTQADLDRFKSGEYTFSAQATAVALTAGAAAKADYKDGMAVFVMADSGLMVDASIGGQKFEFVPHHNR
jgi:lipid-binding SYLF domain-containing protein